MTQHLSDIHRHIRLVETTHNHEEEDLFVEAATAELVNEDRVGVLMEDLGDVIFKLKSYRETAGSEEYALGVEEGLQLAADMLSRLLESHSG